MSGVRPLRQDDIAEVVELRMRAFDPPAESIEPSEMPRHFEEAFLDSSPVVPGLESVVYEGAQGKIEGFFGILGRRGRFKDRDIVIATGTRLMVDPEVNNGLIAVQLMRTLFDGPQDLTYADMVNEPGRRLFSGMGGSVAPVHCLEWTVTLRPARSWLAGRRGLARHRAFRGLARPFASMLDARWRAPGSSAEINVRPLAPPELPDLVEALLSRRSLRPAYRPHDAEKLLRLVSSRRRTGRIQTAVLEGEDGDPVGWYVYLLNSSYVSTTVQLGWRKGSAFDVLRALVVDARRKGARSIRGKLDRELFEPAREIGACTGFSGRWTLARSTDPEIALAVQSGDAFLTGLDGEWPTSYF